MLWFWLSLAVFAGWLWKGGEILIGGIFLTPRLGDGPAPDSPAPLPKISVIFAFRNEPAMESALDTLLAQDYPDFEVIAVNDRSGDEASRRLRARGSDRLKVADVRELPAGWLGKTHALCEGVRASGGEWLLFTDADVRFGPGALARAVGMIHKEKLDHLVLFPRMVLRGLWEGIYVSAFIISFWMRYRPWAARFRRSRAFVGVGAFNMVRREVYDRIGTHEAFCMEVADDMMLGKLVKEAGFRQMAASGERFVSVRWAEGFKGIVASIRKNAFTGFHYNSAFLAVGVTAAVVINLSPYAAAIWGDGAARVSGLLAIGIIFLVYLGMARHMGVRALVYFLAHPAGVLLFLGVVVYSAVSVSRQGGVIWRGTFYSLEELKRHHKM